MQETKVLIRVAGILLAETMKTDLLNMLKRQETIDEDKFSPSICIAFRLNAGTINSFSELHDYMDANMLGAAEAVMSVLSADIPPEGDPARVQLTCDVFEEAFGFVDRWIRDGGLREAVNYG